MNIKLTVNILAVFADCFWLNIHFFRYLGAALAPHYAVGKLVFPAGERLKVCVNSIFIRCPWSDLSNGGAGFSAAALPNRITKQAMAIWIFFVVCNIFLWYSII